MPIKLISLNIEGDKHLDRVLPFLQQQRADVICLQEVFELDLELLTTALGGTIFFAPINNMTTSQSLDSPRGLWGIAIWLRAGLSCNQPNTSYYHGSSTTAHEADDPRFCSRAVMVIALEQEHTEYVIANTHFTWTPDGLASARQREDFATLIKILEPFSELVLCGDFNAPRGGEIFTAFCEHYTDNLPIAITSTLDPELHRYKATLQLVVDTIFSTSQYQVSNVEVFQAISDHKALVATVSLKQ